MPESTDPVPPQRSAARRFLNRLEVDRAVFFGIVARAWQVLAGPVTLLLIAGFLSPEHQGLYYLFGSLLAISTLAELGMNTVILYGASHEWPQLALGADGRITGDEHALRRLARLSRFMNRWYGAVAFLFAVIVVPVGLWYLGRGVPVTVMWRAPWIVTAALTAMNFAISPRMTVLEGCHQISVVNGVRLMQGVLGNAVVWTVLAAGGGLWTLAASAAVKLLVEAWLVWGRYGSFFQSLSAVPGESAFPWRESVWPLQWRLALNSLLNYVTSWIFLFVAREQQGLVAAGKMGMTWTVLTALQSVTLAWVQTRAPLFGSLVARRDFHELDRVFFRLTRISISMMALGSLVVTVGVLTLEVIHQPDASVRGLLPGFVVTFADKLFPRILPTLPTALFCVAILGINLAICLAMYVRAHMRDPFLPYNAISSTLSSVMIWFAALHYGPTGAAAALLVGVFTTTLPFHFHVWRQVRAGHDDAALMSGGGAVHRSNAPS